MPRRVLLHALLTLALPLPLLAQPGPVTPSDYGKWESLGGATLSPQGRWLAYAVSRVNEENELRIRGLARDTTIVVPYGASPAFSGNGRWLAYTIGKSTAERERLEREEEPVRNRAAIVDLESLETVEVDDIASFAFSGDGRYLALRGYPAEDRSAATVIVRDLERGTATSFGDIAAAEWSDDVALLALTIETENGAGNGIQLYDARAGTLRVLDSSTSLYRALAWRDDATELAVLRTRTDSMYRDTTHVVLAWTGVGGPSIAQRTLDPATAEGFPDGMRIAEHRTPSWADDGAAIFIGLRPREPAEKKTADRDSTKAAADTAGAAPADSADTEPAADSTSAKPDEEKVSDVQVWHARDVRIIPMQKAQEQQDLRRTLLAAWHPTDGRVVPLGTDLLESVTVLDGGRFATETDRSAYAFGTMFGRPAVDVWLIDISTGERRKVVENSRWYYGSSATGRHLLWFDGENFWSYDIAGGTSTNLTGSIDAEFALSDYDYPVEVLPSHGIAGWTVDDGALLVYDEFDVWSVAPDGSGGRRLTDGQDDGVVHRYRATADDDDGIDTTRPIYLALHGKRTKKSGFARIPPGGDIERLLWEDARTQRFLRADSADVFAFTRERFDDSPDWFIADADLSDARQLSETNPFQSDYAWGRAELVDFTSKAGTELQAVLLYPAGYDASRTYPMIVYTYERLSDDVHNYVVPSERSYYNHNVFTANGYFVLLPDIVYRGRDPGISALEAVEPAVATVVDRGTIDPARVGLVGHSWGGYQATYLPTRTDIFAASVAGAPITNFLSFAGAIHWNPGISEFDHWETGQARMGVPPWEDFDAYLRNSPIHQVDQLDTPMLMMFGDADGVVDWHQGIEFYNFARRAGADDFVMLVYPGEDHGLRKKENQIDYHRRILEWFGHWLKDEPAPAWIEEGVTWLDRKKTLDGAATGAR